VAAGLAIGDGAPVRAELELGPAPADPAALAAQLAMALSSVPNLACEGLSIGVADAGAVERACALVRELRVLGVAAPIVARGPVAFAQRVEGAARLAIPAGDAARAPAGRPVELLLEAPLAGLPAAIDAALAGAAATGAVELLLSAAGPRPVHAARVLAARLCARGASHPIVLRFVPASQPGAFVLCAATDLGAPLCDGIGDAIVLPAGTDPARALALAYRILQGARLRTTWTEFISCPSCGRTLFDLEEVTARIQARTGHLEGVKIAIMGCIVNGPGEMADADFGYVGSGPGRINLYVGKELVERNVPEAEADDRLVELIRKHGRWIEAGDGG
jgi:hypothetical protein